MRAHASWGAWLGMGIAGLLVVAGCGGGGIASTTSAHPLVVDTNVGPDDVVALLYLLRDPAADVRAVTVSGDGLARCDAGVARVLGVLALAGRADVPVACGPEHPRGGGHAFPDEWREGVDAMPGMALPTGGAPDPRGAVDLLADVLADSPTPVDVVTLGPLTTLATLLADHPEVRDRIGTVQVMGGALRVPGNVAEDAVAEWNMWVDPSAAYHVLRSGLDVTLVALDATNDVPLTIHLFRTLAAHHTQPATGAWYGYLAANPFQYAGGQYLWDEATVMLLATPTLATYTTTAVDVPVYGEDAGRTVPVTDGPTIRVALTLDRAGLEARLLDRLEGGPVAPVAPAPDVAVTVDDDGATLVQMAAPAVGPVVVDLTSTARTPMRVAIGRLTDGATEADLRALERAEVPPWFAVEGYTTLLPGDTTTLVVEIADPGTHWVATAYEVGRPPFVAGHFEVTP